MYAGGIVINPENTHYLVIKDTESNRKIIDKWGDYFPFEFKNKKLILVYNPYKPIDKPSFDFDEFTSLEILKSINFTFPLLSTIIFSGLMSLCTIPLAWR